MRSRNWGLIAGVALVIGGVVLGIGLIWRGGPQESVSAPPTPTPQTDAAPSPSLAPSPTPLPPVTYTVKEGDTLSGIAQAYDISLEELIDANGIANPDFLQLGQTLIIPQGGDTDPAALGPPAASSDTSPAGERDGVELPTLTPSGPALVEIREVLNVGDLTGEAVVLENRGGTVDLQSWTLSTVTNDSFVFPALTLFTGAAVRVHSASGEDTPRDLYWGRQEPAWQEGGLVTLRDADGNVVDTYILSGS
ncbi:MAG: LysM peptidoglycan-binding domain-containing protein [Chloroflexota bacterium]|nr:LysM peptidoglycan-binding domain-containing protein [Chloroflexota bacterium]